MFHAAGILLCTLCLLFQAEGQEGSTTQEEAHPATTMTAPGDAAEIVLKVSGAEREAGTITAYDLDVHLTPATSGIVARAGMTVRNDGSSPLTRLVLQVSSTLRWESFSAKGARLRFASQVLETDVDHTGFVSEAVVLLPQPLGPGASFELSGIYAGTLGRSSVRLDRIGAPADRAELAEWDEVTDGLTALRGFGEVVWYPVAAAPVFLGDGAKFFAAVGAMRARERNTTTRLRLAVEYIGEAPYTAFFCGRMERLTAHSENQNVPVDESPGVATAEFALEPLGFRTLSLFVTSLQETRADGGLVSAVTPREDVLAGYQAAAKMVQPMLAEWYGSAGPETPVRLIDHGGQTFEDGPLLVTQMRVADAGSLAVSLVEPLSRVWMPARQPWIEEGLARFFSLLWMERTLGREAAAAAAQQSLVALALAEPSGKGEGQRLVEARDEVYFRTKAAAVWSMLRAIVGEDALKASLARFRQEANGADETRRLERILAQKSGASVAWFFDDWVYADKGLPDLSIVRVTPRALPAKGGKEAGWLVAVEVRNDGDAVAEVPVTVRSGTLTATERLRIAGRQTASTRILFEQMPDEVQVNDGSVPEMGANVHRTKIGGAP